MCPTSDFLWCPILWIAGHEAPYGEQMARVHESQHAVKVELPYALNVWFTASRTTNCNDASFGTIADGNIGESN